MVDDLTTRLEAVTAERDAALAREAALREAFQVFIDNHYETSLPDPDGAGSTEIWRVDGEDLAAAQAALARLSRAM